MRFYYPKEYKALLKLGVPITIGQLGLTLQNLADNIMVGRHSTEELAAAGFINNLVVLGILLTVGFSVGAVPKIGALFAQKNTTRIVDYLKSSIVADFAQGVLICAALGVLYFTLPYLGQPEELMPLMRPYLLIQICSLPFLATSNAFKQFVDCINDTMVSMTIMLIGNAWNIFFNWVMIFGHLGCPEMGIEGAAWATLSSRVVIFLLFILVFCCRKKYKKYSSQWSTCKASHADVLTLNKLGWPIAFQMGIETASFSLTAIFLGWIGTTALAANQVMLNIANVIFMFYVGISSAVSIRVSNYNGLHDVTGVRHAAFGGYQMAVTLGIVLTIAAVSFSKNISALFTDSTEVAAIVSSLVLPLVLYQFGDGMQTTFANALRGLGDVKKLMKYSTIAYIIISLPLSYIFGIVLEWGTFGVWMGYPFGLTTAALLYFTRFLKITKNTQPIE